MTDKQDGMLKIIKDIYNILKFELIFCLMKNLGISTETKRRMVNDFCVFIGAGNLPLKSKPLDRELHYPNDQ